MPVLAALAAVDVRDGKAVRRRALCAVGLLVDPEAVVVGPAPLGINTSVRNTTDESVPPLSTDHMFETDVVPSVSGVYCNSSAIALGAQYGLDNLISRNKYGLR